MWYSNGWGWSDWLELLLKDAVAHAEEISFAIRSEFGNLMCLVANLVAVFPSLWPNVRKLNSSLFTKKSEEKLERERERKEDFRLHPMYIINKHTQRQGLIHGAGIQRQEISCTWLVWNNSTRIEWICSEISMKGIKVCREYNVHPSWERHFPQCNMCTSLSFQTDFPS